MGAALGFGLAFALTMLDYWLLAAAIPQACEALPFVGVVLG